MNRRRQDDLPMKVIPGGGGGHCEEGKRLEKKTKGGTKERRAGFSLR